LCYTSITHNCFIGTVEVGYVNLAHGKSIAKLVVYTKESVRLIKGSPEFFARWLVGSIAIITNNALHSVIRRMKPLHCVYEAVLNGTSDISNSLFNNYQHQLLKCDGGDP
jgi:hypothetical protein